MLEKNSQCPLNICSWPGRNGPAIISICGNRQKRAKGDLCIVHNDHRRLVPRSDKNHAVFGGFLTLQPSQKVMVTAELGDPTKLLTVFFGEDFDKPNGLNLNFFLPKLSFFRITTTFLWSFIKFLG